MIVTIDGPAGSGKSSTAKAVAGKLGWHYLDSGSLYRTWTLLYDMGGADKQSFLGFLDVHKVTLDVNDSGTEPLLNQEPVGDEIRSARISGHVSTVAAMPEVREKVNAEMRRVASIHNFVADGRDLGSVVFPDAVMKFFMIADLDERTRRRVKELEIKGLEADYNEVRKNLKARDEKDASRKAAPLRKPEGAIEVDTTSTTFEGQVEFITNRIESGLSGR